MKVRFTAFSISSMHMNIAMTFRFMITPAAPIVNRTAESARYQESCGSMLLLVRVAQSIDAEQGGGFVRSPGFHRPLVADGSWIDNVHRQYLASGHNAHIRRQHPTAA